MADLADYGSSDRDLTQALLALKKGTQLIKYGRKGKPKVCSFRLSNDESTLIWLSGAEERILKLALVTKVVPGQRTSVFQRHPCPEKDSLSFSFIYNNGERSLDLICKDKSEAESWFGGLNALVLSGQQGRSKIDGRSVPLYLDDCGDLSSSGRSESSFVPTIETGSPKISINQKAESLSRNHSFESSFHTVRSDVGLDDTNMQIKGSVSDALRVSVSSVPSSSSQGSAQEDCDAIGEVYIWGQVVTDTPLNNESDKPPRVDILLPRPLESNIVLDVHHIACGASHAALVTRQGEVFTWGEELGGRLGYGVGIDASQPRLVESLASSNSDFVACGEFHTCVVTLAGELFTWGDGKHNSGLLGHGSGVSHWLPKRVCGPFEGIQVASVACGPWHTAVVTSNGQLFTFGDGIFGALGHGDRESIPCPREVESLKGLKTISVACGVWHTAAAVEVIMKQSTARVSSGKLFTWGDGDKNRLGHGDKETRLVPTCVSVLIEHNFYKVACGNSLTVGLTTSGNVYTMGSTVYGQLGNTRADGKLPSLVEDRLAGEHVEEIACGSYHVAVLTSKSEVYTWGKGANGRLGHGDIEDRKTPTLVDGLKDRHVKHIACGSNFTAAICLHRWVSGSDQSQCSACRQAFGFTRKRHNCYNCGLVHCHSCSSKKSLRAALAPNPGKPHRVCESCYWKLNRISETGGSLHNKKSVIPRLSSESKDKLEIKSSKSDLLDLMNSKQGKKADALSLIWPSQMGTLLQLKDIAIPGAVAMHRAHKSTTQAASHSVTNSRSVSPFSRKSSPPRSTTPIPTVGGLSLSKGVSDGLKKTNELLNQEVLKLRGQVESLRQRCERQEYELQKSAKKSQEALSLATEESAKCKAAKEVIKSLTAQLKDMAERLPRGVYDNNNMRPIYLPNGVEPHSIIHYPNLQEESRPSSHSIRYSDVGSTVSVGSPSPRDVVAVQDQNGPIGNNHSHSHSHSHDAHDLNDFQRDLNGSATAENDEKHALNNSTTATTRPEAQLVGKKENGDAITSAGTNQVQSEWIEQYEPGVYITLLALHDGTRDIKRVRFSRKRFAERQAETWWSENREKVFNKYNVQMEDRFPVAPDANT